MDTYEAVGYQFYLFAEQIRQIYTRKIYIYLLKSKKSVSLQAVLLNSKL